MPHCHCFLVCETIVNRTPTSRYGQVTYRCGATTQKCLFRERQSPTNQYHYTAAQLAVLAVKAAAVVKYDARDLDVQYTLQTRGLFACRSCHQASHMMEGTQRCNNPQPCPCNRLCAWCATRPCMLRKAGHIACDYGDDWSTSSSTSLFSPD